jgi:hypothetical protein
MRRFMLKKNAKLGSTEWLDRKTVYEGKLLSMTDRVVRLFPADPAAQKTACGSLLRLGDPGPLTPACLGETPSLALVAPGFDDDPCARTLVTHEVSVDSHREPPC